MNQKKNQKEWTIMVYMAGDNNLAVDMAYAMEQIKEVAGKSADKLNLLVYYDGSSPDIPTLYCDFSDPKAPLQDQYVPSESVHESKPYEVPKKRNENAADTKSILNFVDWCVNKRGRRAEKYALIFSGHSLGFADKGLFKDETSGKSMKITDLFYALQRLALTKEELEKAEPDCKELSNRDELLGKNLDILGFDSCLMGMLEVGYQFATITKTMLVSEGSVPSAGWSYAKILTDLASGSYKDTKDVARHFVKSFIESQDKYIIGGISVDMAAWDMKQFNELACLVDVLSFCLMECFDNKREKKGRIHKQMERIILQVHWKCQSYMFDQNIDLGDFCELLIQECESVVQEELLDGDDTQALSEVILACQDVLKALERTVILSGFSGGEYQYSNGVSLFFPWSWEAYEVSQKNYQGTWYSQDHRNKDDKWVGWDDFLKKYLKEVARRAPATITAKRSWQSQELSLDSSDSKKYVYVSGINFDKESSSQAPEPLETKAGGGTMGGSSKAGGGTTGGSSKAGGGTTGGSSKAGGGTTGESSKAGGGAASTSSSKMGGGGADGFFDTLKLRKNIKIRWDISGFTKNPDEHEPEC